jgi:hypothetical protein
MFLKIIMAENSLAENPFVLRISIMLDDKLLHVGNQAIKAMISSYSTGGIKAMTDEQRDELAAKLSNRHE